MRFTHTFIFCLFHCMLLAQGWIKTYDLGNYELGEQISASADGNLLLMGHFGLGDEGTFILKTTTEGDSLSSFVIWGVEAAQFLEAADGHFWLTGKKDDFPFLMKVNALGEVLFEANFIQNGEGQRIKEMATGDIVWMGFEDNHPSRRVFDAEGNLLDWQLFEQFNTTFPTHSAINDSGEIFFVLNENSTTNEEGATVVKANQQGEILWQSTHSEMNNCNIGAHYLEALPEAGAILVVGKQCMNWATPFLEAYKFDGTGEKFAAGGYGHSQQYPWYTDIYPISENDYVFCGNTQLFANSSERYGLLGRVSNDANFTNVLFPNEGGQYEIEGVLPMSDSCYYLIAKHYPGISLIKMDQYGQLNNSNYLTGQLFHDENANCEVDASEANFENWTVELRDESGNILNTQPSNTNGGFEFQVDTGIYQITTIPPDSNWIACLEPLEVTFSNFFDTIFIESGWRDTCPDFSNTFNFNTVCGEGIGEIQIASTGGHGNFSYEWSNGDIGNTAQNLTAGQYHVSIQDNNCQYVDSVEMTFSKQFLTNWMHLYGGNEQEHIEDAIMTDAEEIVLFGYTQSASGDVSISYGSNDFWVAKLDTLGNLLWEKTYGGSGVEFAGGIQQTTDGGFILVGSTTSIDGDLEGINTNNRSKLICIKLDENGEKEWVQIYGEGAFTTGKDIVQTQDGGYAFIGYSRFELGIYFDWLVGKMDASGEILWTENFGITNYDKAGKIAENSIGELIVSGDYNEQLMVMKLSNEGAVIWENLLSTPNDEMAADLLVLPDDAIIALGQFDWIHKLSTDGDLIWATNYQERISSFASIKPASDGGFWVVENQNLEEIGVLPYHPSTKSEAGILKIDKLGQVEFDYHLKGEKFDFGAAVLPKNEEELFLFGDTQSKNFSYYEEDQPDEYNIFATHLTGVFQQADVLPKDTIFCTPSTEILALANPNFQIQSAVWEDGTTDLQRLVQIDTDTSFSVIIETTEGCVAADEIFVVANKLATTEIIANPNCRMDNGTVTVQPIQGDYSIDLNSHQVVWETGDTTFTLNDLTIGTYDYEISDGLCAESGTVELFLQDIPQVVWSAESFGHYLGSPPFINYNVPVTSLVQGADGDFYGLWRGRFTKATKEGTFMWSNIGNDLVNLVPLANNHILGVGYQDVSPADVVRVVLFDKTGEIVNENTFGGTELFKNASAIDAKENSVGEIFVLVQTTANSGIFTGNHGETDVFVLKLDADLNLLWVENFGSSASDLPLDLTVLPNDDLVVAAKVSVGDFDVPTILGEADIWLFRIAGNNGDLLWSKNYGGTNEEEQARLLYADNKIWLAMNTRSSDGDLADLENLFLSTNALIQLDLSGNILQVQRLTSELEEGDFYDINANIDGTLSATHTSTSGTRLSKISATGQVLWQRTMNPQTIPTQSNGYLSSFPEEDITIYQLPSGDWVNQLYGKQIFQLYGNGGLPTPVILPADTILCAGDSLLIQADLHPELHYNWSNGGVGNQQIITQSGLYELTVSTLPECTHTDEILIDFCDEFSLPAPTVTCDSTLVTSGFAGGDYLWNNGDTSETTYLYEPGWAILEMIHPDGTVLIDSIYVDVFENNLVIDAAFSDSICYQSEMGFINLTANQNVVNFNWNTGEITANLDNLSGGIYEVVATDSLGCEQQLSVEIAELSLLTVSFSKQRPLCANFEDGAITAIVSGSAAPYDYSWSTGATTPEITELLAGEYSLTVTDNRNCQHIQATILTPTSNAEIIVFDLNHPTQGANDGYVFLLTENAPTPLQFTWSDGGTGSVRNDLSAGTYTVTLTDGEGCETMTTIELEVINETKEIHSSSIAVFPNPFEEVLFIDLKNNEIANATLEIYNVFGQKVEVISQPNLDNSLLKIETSEWGSGTYFIKYQTVLKIVKL